MLERIQLHSCKERAIQKKINPSVLYIISPSDGSSGSGILIDIDRKLVITNEHITKGSDQVRVFFPAYDYGGEIIKEKEFYQLKVTEVVKILERTGYVTKGRVIAEDTESDLAIVRVDGLPASVKQIDYEESYDYTPLYEKRAVHIIGHPNDQRDLLWQWDAAHFQKVDQDTITLDASAWFGNSGGPVVDGMGVLIGIAKSISHSGETYAVSMPPIINLLNAIENRFIFCITNGAESAVDYKIKWYEDEDWKPYTLEPGAFEPHMKREDEYFANNYKGYPKIQFGSTEQDNNVEYPLIARLEYFANDAKERINPDLDGVSYQFRIESGSKLKLFERRKMLWIANHATHPVNYMMQWKAGAIHKKSFKLSSGEVIPHWGPPAETYSPKKELPTYPRIEFDFYASGNLTQMTMEQLPTEYDYFDMEANKKHLILNYEENKDYFSTSIQSSKGTLPAHYHFTTERVATEHLGEQDVVKLVRFGLSPRSSYVQKNWLPFADWNWKVWVAIILLALGGVILREILPKKTAIFSLQNNTDTIVNYVVKWNKDEEWSSDAVEPGEELTHWNKGAPKKGYPLVGFDLVVDNENGQDVHTQTLETNTRHLGRKSVDNIGREDARKYHFEFDSETATLKLCDSEAYD